MEIVKRQYPEDYAAMKQVEHFIDYFLDFKSMREMGISINANEMRYGYFKVVEYIERILSGWRKS